MVPAFFKKINFFHLNNIIAKQNDILKTTNGFWKIKEIIVFNTINPSITIIAEKLILNHQKNGLFSIIEPTQIYDIVNCSFVKSVFLAKQFEHNEVIFGAYL